MADEDRTAAAARRLEDLFGADRTSLAEIREAIADLVDAAAHDGMVIIGESLAAAGRAHHGG